MGPLTASTYSYLWSHSFAVALQECGRNGYDRVELMASAPHLDRSSLHDEGVTIAKAAAAKSGVSIVGVNLPGLDLNLVSSDASVRALSINRYLDAVSLCSELGSDYLVLVVGRRHPLLPAPLGLAEDRLESALEVILPVARNAGIIVVLENTPSNFLDRAHELQAFVERLGTPDGLRLCYDVANAWMVEDPLTAYPAIAALTEVVHLSDTTRQCWRHDPIGDGEIDFSGLATVVGALPPVHLVLETIHTTGPTEGLARDRAILDGAGWPV